MNITPWKERIDYGQVGTTWQLKYMQAEIDELRAALKAQPVQPAPLTDEQINDLRKNIVTSGGVFASQEWCQIFARAAIEAALRTGGAG